VGAAGMVCAPRLASISKTLQDACEQRGADSTSREHARSTLTTWFFLVDELINVLRSDEPKNLVTGPPIEAT